MKISLFFDAHALDLFISRYLSGFQFNLYFVCMKIFHIVFLGYLKYLNILDPVQNIRLFQKRSVHNVFNSYFSGILEVRTFFNLIYLLSP